MVDMAGAGGPRYRSAFREGVPPATSTEPSSSTTALGSARGTDMVPARVQVFERGSYTSLLALPPEPPVGDPPATRIEPSSNVATAGCRRGLVSAGPGDQVAETGS
jgi:hypothetical protein